VVRIISPKVDPETQAVLLDENGQPQMHESVMVLDTMEKYYNFKNHDYPAGTVYQVDVLTPRNLKPSLIRWKYINESGQEVYMNIFDHPVIKSTFDLKGELDANYRK
jgi:hypothetical protein